ncbi:MAG: glycosyltransferase family 2 protein [Thermoplasmatota archaeon]
MKEVKTPRFSVIVPVRNRKKMLSRCIKTILDQTISDLELIIVDNGSTDDTREYIKDLLKKDPRIRYLEESERGIGRARNRGEIASKGEIVLMTDSDCEVPRNWIERMSAPIIEGSVPAVQGLKHAIKRNYWSTNVEREEHRIMWSLFERHGSSNVDTANFCIQRKVLKKVGYSNRKMNNLNDTELAARLFQKGYGVALLDLSVGHHNPLSPWVAARKLVQRGAYHTMVRKRYPDNPALPRETIRMFLGYLLGLVSEMLHIDRSFPYDLVSGISWRFGLVCGTLMRPR